MMSTKSYHIYILTRNCVVTLQKYSMLRPVNMYSTIYIFVYAKYCEEIRERHSCSKIGKTGMMVLYTRDSTSRK